MDGLVKGSVIHFHLARTVTINPGGLVTSLELGEFCVLILFPMDSFCVELIPLSLCQVENLNCIY